MKKQPLIALGLIIGFSASSVFAENKPAGIAEYNNTVDRLTLAQRNAIGAKSDLSNAILNARNYATPDRGTSSFSPKFSSNRPKNRKRMTKREPKADSTGRKRSFTEKASKHRRSDDRRPDDSANNERSAKPKKSKKGENRLSGHTKRLYRMIENGRNLNQLSAQEKSRILELHKRMLKTEAAQVLLATIQKGEGGGPLVIVGKGYGKSKKFRRIMNNLDFSRHPADQFPKGMRCFVYNRDVQRCSTAAGSYQITKSNWDYYKKQFGLKDFSVESQQIVALELIRTGSTPVVAGAYKGRGYVEMMKGNVRNAVRYGTNDWASSRYSEWKGRKTDYVRDAETIAKARQNKSADDLKDQAYFQGWLDEFDAAAE